MNLVKLTNRIAMAAVVLLIYWVFIFVCSTVFGFTGFQRNTSEIFMLSILGIFSILAGAVVLNIMLNLTAMADRRGGNGAKVAKLGRMHAAAFLASFVVLFALLFLGDLATSRQRESYLVSAAANLIDEQTEIISRLSDYRFSREYIEKAGQDIKVLERVDEEFPSVTVIVRDTLDDKPLLLGFTSRPGLGRNEEALKADYILSTSSGERAYLHSIFDGASAGHRFSSKDGRYEIYHPIKANGRTIVLHLSKHSRYGKIGS